VTNPPSCDQIVPTAAGAINVPPQPFDNRGTFYQAVAIDGHRGAPAGADGDRGAAAYGAANSSSSESPSLIRIKNESLLVFSSNLLTRYAIPATRSPTGQ